MRVRAHPDRIHQPSTEGQTFPTFTAGRVYVVCAIAYDDYRLVNDAGEPVLAPMERFDVVAAGLPSWSLRTEDHQGPGMFLVPGFFERWHDGDARFKRLFELEFRRVLAEDESRNGPLRA